MEKLLAGEREKILFLKSDLGQERECVRGLNSWNLRKSRAKDSWKRYCEGEILSLMGPLGPDCFLP